MFVPGLIYRHYRPVHYSPSSRSALAEAELVYKDDHISHSVYVTFDLDTNSRESSVAFRNLVAGHTKVQLLVWTTTPWTLTANMVRTFSYCSFLRSHVYVQGVAVHPDMTYALIRPTELSNEDASVFIVAQERLEALSKVIGKAELVAHIQGRSSLYNFAVFMLTSRIGSELAGARYRPLFSSLASDAASESLAVIASTHVTSDSGTGLVHCAPAHGAEDYNLFKQEGLLSSTSNIVCHVGEGGLFTNEVTHVVGKEAGQTLVGQPVLDNGSRTIVDHLKNMKRLLKIERFKHRYPYDWKTDKPIIVTYVHIVTR